MKPLELTVYLSDEDGDYQHPVTREWVSWMEVEDQGEAKRLTNAELSAEHWSSCALWFNAVRRDDDYEGAPDTREHQRQALIFERFATLPHYDEVAQ